MMDAPNSLEEELARAVRDPALIEAGAALHRNDLPVAERLIKEHLRAQPGDVAALRMLAELAARLRRYSDAAALLTRALDLRPEFRAARLNLCSVLQRTEKIEEATRHVDMLLAEEPDDPAALAVAAAIRVRRGEFNQAVEAYTRVLTLGGPQPQLRVSLGHVLKTLGKQSDAIAAYRQAIAEAPSFGDAWWSLANLKTIRFNEADRDAMIAALDSATRLEDRLHLHFALGKAFEDAAAYERSFEHYREGNRLRRSQADYDPRHLTGLVDHSIESLTAEHFADLREGGHPSSEPIFIVGLPRSGSTLIEQILASHSKVEGTAELPHLPAIVRDLAKDRGEDDPRYIDVLLRLSPDERVALGRTYLERSAIQRKTGRRHFIDKLPNNFAHIALIELVLPNATIIDARRHPVATCFSCYKQHFARGQEFTYDLGDLTAYYRDYVRLLNHYDAVLPGRVHRVVNEALIETPETEIRALLAACGLDFEAACLDFHRTERPIRTASSEQVRQPLNRDGVDQWRHYRPWLSDLIAAVGSEEQIATSDA